MRVNRGRKNVLKIFQPAFDFVHGGIGGRGAGGEADGGRVHEPFGAQVFRALDVVDAGAMAAAGGNEFVGVVAVRPADHHDDRALTGQFDGGALALFRGATNGVNEAHFGMGKAPAKLFDQAGYFVHRLGGLRGDAKARMFGQFEHVGVVENDIELFQIAGESAHFDVVAFANDDRMKTLGGQLCDGLVRELHEGTGGFEDVEAALLQLADRAVGCTVSGDHYGRRGHLFDGRLELDARRAQIGEDGFIVDEVAENGEGRIGVFPQGERDGVAHAKTHPPMFCSNDSHG